MTANGTLPLVMWVVSCFDKRRENPLPVYNRTFLLDWSRLSPHQVTEVLSIVNEKSCESKHSPDGFDTAVVTLSRSQSPPDWRMLKFRKYFTVAAQLFHVIRQDYESWISDHALDKPARDDIRSLFESERI